MNNNRRNPEDPTAATRAVEEVELDAHFLASKGIRLGCLKVSNAEESVEIAAPSQEFSSGSPLKSSPRDVQEIAMKLSDRIWNEESSDFAIRKLIDLPIGYRSARCPKCGSASISGAIILNRRGVLAIEGTDELDANLVCQICRFWWD